MIILAIFFRFFFSLLIKTPPTAYYFILNFRPPPPPPSNCSPPPTPILYVYLALESNIPSIDHWSHQFKHFQITKFSQRNKPDRIAGKFSWNIHVYANFPVYFDGLIDQTLLRKNYIFTDKELRNSYSIC